MDILEKLISETRPFSEMDQDEAADEIRRLRAAMAAQDGCVLVPTEPTIAMCIAGDHARLNVDDATRSAPIYRAMLAAARGPNV